MIPSLVVALAPLLPGLIKGAEALFTSSKAGTTRMSTILDMLRTVAGKLIDTGHAGLPSTTPAPTDEQLQTFIEAKFQELKAKGQLTAPAAPTGGLYILHGTVTPVA